MGGPGAGLCRAVQGCTGRYRAVQGCAALCRALQNWVPGSGLSLLISMHQFPSCASKRKTSFCWTTPPHDVWPTGHQGPHCCSTLGCGWAPCIDRHCTNAWMGGPQSCAAFDALCCVWTQGMLTDPATLCAAPFVACCCPARSVWCVSQAVLRVCVRQWHTLASRSACCTWQVNHTQVIVCTLHAHAMCTQGAARRFT